MENHEGGVCLWGMNAWEQIKTHLGSRLSGESYENWLAETAFRGLESGILYVRVPNDGHARFMEEEYAEVVASADRALWSLPVSRMVYELGSGG